MTINEQTPRHGDNYHVLHVGRRRKDLPPHFVVVVEDGQHVVLADVPLPPHPGARAVAVRRAAVAESERGCSRDRARSRARSARRAQEQQQQVRDKQLMFHDYYFFLTLAPSRCVCLGELRRQYPTFCNLKRKSPNKYAGLKLCALNPRFKRTPCFFMCGGTLCALCQERISS